MKYCLLLLVVALSQASPLASKNVYLQKSGQTVVSGPGGQPIVYGGGFTKNVNLVGGHHSEEDSEEVENVVGNLAHHGIVNQFTLPAMVHDLLVAYHGHEEEHPFVVQVLHHLHEHGVMFDYHNLAVFVQEILHVMQTHRLQYILHGKVGEFHYDTHAIAQQIWLQHQIHQVIYQGDYDFQQHGPLVQYILNNLHGGYHAYGDLGYVSNVIQDLVAQHYIQQLMHHYQPEGSYHQQYFPYWLQHVYSGIQNPELLHQLNIPSGFVQHHQVPSIVQHLVLQHYIQQWMHDLQGQGVGFTHENVPFIVQHILNYLGNEHVWDHQLGGQQEFGYGDHGSYFNQLFSSHIPVSVKLALQHYLLQQGGQYYGTSENVQYPLGQYHQYGDGYYPYGEHYQYGQYGHYPYAHQKGQYEHQYGDYPYYGQHYYQGHGYPYHQQVPYGQHFGQEHVYGQEGVYGHQGVGHYGYGFQAPYGEHFGHHYPQMGEVY